MCNSTGTRNSHRRGDLWCWLYRQMVYKVWLSSFQHWLIIAASRQVLNCCIRQFYGKNHLPDKCIPNPAKSPNAWKHDRWYFFQFFNLIWNSWNQLKEWVNRKQQNNYLQFQYKDLVKIVIKREKKSGKSPHTKISCDEKESLIHRKEVGFKP